jgi:hypothetical protein
MGNLLQHSMPIPVRKTGAASAAESGSMRIPVRKTGAASAAESGLVETGL